MSAEYTIKNLSLKEITIKFGIELNFALLAGNAPDRYYYFPKKTIEDKKLASTGIVEKVTELGLVDEWQKLDINLKLNNPATIWRFPIETVSQSDAGFERVYQSSVVVPNWVLHLAPKQVWQVSITQTYTVTQTVSL